MYDLVYPLSPGPLDYSELKYSLRSVEKNVPAERVWFLGGKPPWLRTANHLKTRQPYDKMRNARIQLWTAVLSDDISDPFIWMNDDFYIMEPVDELPMWHGGDWEQWLATLGPRYANSPYLRDAKLTISLLRKELWPNFSPLCWSLHTPILVWKGDMKTALTIDDSCGQKLHLRSLYANLAGLEGVQAPCHDVKQNAAVPPGQVYASSANATWPTSQLGKQIRSRFTEKSRWER
jgi:hypothetical protein